MYRCFAIVLFGVETGSAVRLAPLLNCMLNSQFSNCTRTREALRSYSILGPSTAFAGGIEHCCWRAATWRHNRCGTACP